MKGKALVPRRERSVNDFTYGGNLTQCFVNLEPREETVMPHWLKISVNKEDVSDKEESSKSRPVEQV